MTEINGDAGRYEREIPRALAAYVAPLRVAHVSPSARYRRGVRCRWVTCRRATERMAQRALMAEFGPAQQAEAVDGWCARQREQ